MSVPLVAVQALCQGVILQRQQPNRLTKVGIVFNPESFESINGPGELLIQHVTANLASTNTKLITRVNDSTPLTTVTASDVEYLLPTGG